MIVPVATHGGSDAAESVHRIAEVTGARVLGEGFPAYSSDIPFERQAVGGFVKGIRAELEAVHRGIASRSKKRLRSRPALGNEAKAEAVPEAEGPAIVR